MVIALMFGVRYFFIPWISNEPDLIKLEFDIRKFSGNIKSVEGETITLNGTYNTNETVPEELLAKRDFAFKVNRSTKFEKAETRFPSWEELKTAGKVSGNIARYNLEPSVGLAGSLTDLKNSISKGDILVEANFPVSIYRVQNPTASFIFYYILIRPSQQPTLP